MTGCFKAKIRAFLGYFLQLFNDLIRSDPDSHDGLVPSKTLVISENLLNHSWPVEGTSSHVQLDDLVQAQAGITK